MKTKMISKMKMGDIFKEKENSTKNWVREQYVHYRKQYKCYVEPYNGEWKYLFGTDKVFVK